MKEIDTATRLASLCLSPATAGGWGGAPADKATTADNDAATAVIGEVFGMSRK